MNNENDKIRITTDEVNRVVIDPITRPAPPPPPISRSRSAKQWGRIDSAAQPSSQTRPSLLLKAWIYLAISGLVGAFTAWAISEPTYKDFGPHGLGNTLIFPAFGVLVSVGFVISESIVERSWRKALIRIPIAILLGVILSFIFDFFAEIIYRAGLTTLYNSGGRLTIDNPMHWIIRAAAWCIFGVTGGVVYGIAGQSAKKCMYGVIGGIIGAAIGGLVFDPISMLFGAAGPSRSFGFMVMGAATGAAIGFVESALKDRWLYVSAGPLAGKQFVLYKPETRIGSDQANDIYLFKDPSVAPQHAMIQLRGGRSVLVAAGPTFVSGQPITEKPLQNGDLVQIGRYAFNYQEKQRTG